METGRGDLPATGYGGWQEDTVELADYIRVLWRRRYLIVIATFMCALTAFVVSKVMPKVYQATATLMLLPPRFSTELRPPPLSVETYQSILQSDYIANKVKSKLVQSKVVKPTEDIKGMMSVKVYTSKEKDQPYRPLVDLIVEADSPKKAETIANTWAEVFVNEARWLAGKGKKGTLEFIEKEYPVAKERLAALEAKLKETEDRYDRQIRETEDLWDAKITDFKARWKIESLKKQLEAIERELTGVSSPLEIKSNTKEGDKQVVSPIITFAAVPATGSTQEGLLGKLHDVQLKIKHTRDTLEELKKEIKAHPQFIVVSKAITDDALWEKIGKDFSGETAKQLEVLKLRTEELNPVYHNLLQRLADTQVAYDALVPQEQHLQEQIAARRKEAEELHQLILSKELELERMEREKETALTMLKRERDFKVGELRREVESSKATYSTLAQKYESARLAKAEEDQDVKVGAYAVAPERHIKPKTLMNTAIAFAVGLMLSVMLAFFIEYIQSVPLAQPKSEVEEVALKSLEYPKR